jgi:hypothetical protein
MQEVFSSKESFRILDIESPNEGEQPGISVRWHVLIVISNYITNVMSMTEHAQTCSKYSALIK